MWWLKFKRYFSLLVALFFLFYSIGSILNLGDYEFVHLILMVLYPLALLIFWLNMYKLLLYFKHYLFNQSLAFFFISLAAAIILFIADERLFLSVSNFWFWAIIYKEKIYAQNHIILRQGETGFLKYKGYLLKIDLLERDGFHDVINYVLFYKQEIKAKQNYLPLQYNYFSYTVLEIQNFWLVFKPTVKQNCFSIEFFLVPRSALSGQIMEVSYSFEGGGKIRRKFIKKFKI